MKRLVIILLLFTGFALTPYAQQRRTKKPAVTNKTSKSGQSKKSSKKSKSSKNTKQPTTVQALEKQRKQIQQQIKEQERRLASSQKDVKKRLQNLMILNTEIAGKRRTIDTIRHDISNLDQEIEQLGVQLEMLKKQLADCKKRYVKSMRYMHRNRSTQSKMMFIFSADNFTQMFRRMRFMREYAAYQHVQGDEVKAQQEEVNRKLQEISMAKEHKSQLLAKGERERIALEGKQAEQQNVVKTLQKEQKTIQSIIAQQKKKDAALNAQIDRLIAEEVARQKARAEAEARRRAEAAARERELAEAKAREEKARAEAMAAKDKKTREAAERRVREAEEKRAAAQRKAESVPLRAPSEDVRISGNFESNRGRLPMPITGAYRIVSHFGQYNVEGLHNVTLDNKGINIKGEAGAQARSIFDGEVSGVFSFGGTMVVMVRHGSYISVYCNLASVNVHRGQRVSTRQTLGRVGADNILQFQLRKETAKLNPESWLGR
ncbi:Septal ring factor EnvC, activator of murein hydrolases AmiA and AmiB [Prevotellaceae bacterium HUN156]|nr:Septal ring factor EnvC, activator of murein hydrolases AmiA and AmiB [Prevotellaceae bacterium HUN156]